MTVRYAGQRCALVRCTACKAECIRKGRENAANKKLFATLDRVIERTKPVKS
jgi:hypothetical protein